MFCFKGDLCQMADQERELRRQGFAIKNSDVFPVVESKDEYKEALRFIWDRRVNGWWNYMDDFIEYGICDAEEFTSSLRRQVEVEKILRNEG